ncbi:MAG: RNA 2',3'-cyclic phosphodiesterase [Pyrinomonadaceae bacterium]|nr:RNA 2',3'-cyclic phosphodiesterase [Pyrinomonadaceae bacterium]
MKRVFLAVDISDEAKATIASRVNLLRRKFPDVRASWIRPENLHITTKFYGDVNLPFSEMLIRIGTEAAARCHPFSVSLGEPGSFGSKILWIGLNDPPNGLSELNAIVENLSAEIGFQREKKDYRPHLTIARIRSEKGVRPLIDRHRRLTAEYVQFEINELVLYESRLSPGGSVYTPLSRFPLKGIT